jgi:hypothetical protein
MRHKATPETTENNPQSGPTPRSDFFQDLYGTNKPRVISGGGKITREQAAALGIVPKGEEKDCQ